MTRRANVGDKVRCSGFGDWDKEDMIVIIAKDDGYIEARHPTMGLGSWLAGDSISVINPSVKSGTQLDKVLRLTLGQGSWTLSAIAAATGASEAAASARLRDIRAMGYTVTCSKPAGEKLRRYTVRSEVIALA